jgi:hypothetical protein
MTLAEFGRGSDGILNSALVRVLQGGFAFVGGKAATQGGVSIDTPFATIRSNARGGAVCTLTLVAFTIALLREAQADFSELLVLDDLIKYKDLHHGTLVIAPKGGDTSVIVLDDPELTIIIGPPETGFSVQQVVNSSADMAVLLALSQNVNATYLLGLADPLTTGSVPRAETQTFYPGGPGGTQNTNTGSNLLPPVPDDPGGGGEEEGGAGGGGPTDVLVLNINEELVVEHDHTLLVQSGGDIDDTDDPFPIDLSGLAGFDENLVIGQATDGGGPGDDPFVSTAGSSGPVLITLEPSFDGVYSGLDVTNGGRILLFKEFTDGQQVVVGREEGTNEIAFIIFVTPDGSELWVQELLPIDHGPDGNDPDSLAPIDDNALILRGTLIGTALTQTFPIGEHIVFVDDAPNAVNDDPQQLTEDAAAIGGNVINPELADDADDSGQDDPGTDGATLTHVNLPGPDGFVVITSGTEGPAGVYTFIVVGIGTYTFQANGAWTFDPVLNQSGHPVDASFSYQLTDGDGDFDTATQPISVLDGADPTGGKLGLSVEEPDLDTALTGDDDTGDLQPGTTTGTTPNETAETDSGSLSFTAGSDDVTDFTFGETEGIQVQGLLGSPTIIWTGEGSDTLTGTIDGVPAIVLQLSNQDDIAAGTNGSVTVTATLLDNFPHALLGADSILIGGIQVKALEADGDFGVGQVRVRVLDDQPSAAPVTENLVETAGADTNVLLIFDVSGSMDDPSGQPGLSRLDLAKAAANELLEQYESLGDVRVQIITFSDDASKQGGVWLTVDAAKAFIAGLTADGGSDYDAATALAPDAFDDAGKLETDGVRNVAYFLSDNAPSGGDELSGGEITSWTTFVNNNDIVSFALAMGSGIGTGALNPIAFDGVAGVDTNGTVVTDPLLTPIVPSASSLNPEGGTLVPPGAFGADGGFVKSVTIDDIPYTYDPAANGGDGEVTGAGTFDFDTDTKVLTVTLLSLATFAINMDSGNYTYTPPPTVDADLIEEIGFTLSDGDFDTASNVLTINVANADLPPLVRDDRIITNIVDGSTIVIPEAALLANDTGDGPLDITSVQNDEGGTAVLNSVDFTPDSLAETLLIDADFNGDDDEDGFDYDDGGGFGGDNPASGDHVGNPPGSNDTGALNITLGGNSTTMSGRWDHSFTIAAAGDVTIKFDYRLDLNGGFESDEFGQILMSLTGEPNTLVHQLAGPDGSGNATTDWQSFEVTLTNLDAGTYELGLGAFLSKSTTNDELAQAYFDNVQVIGPGTFTEGSFDYTAADSNGSDDAHVSITGQAGNTITGTGFAEILLAGSGNDTINGAQNDVLIDGGAGNDTLRITANFNDASDAQTTGIENILLASGLTLVLDQQSETGFNVTGSSSADSITLGAGADTVNAGNGNDFVNGGGGGDTLNGGSGNDSLLYTSGIVSIDGGSNSSDNLLTATNRGDILSVSGTVDFTALGDIFQDIETISMLAGDGSPGNTTITLSITDVLQMADGGAADPGGSNGGFTFDNRDALRIDGTAGDVVNLADDAGTWLAATGATGIPAGYTAYSHVTTGSTPSNFEDAYLFVATGVTVNGVGV